MKNSINFSDVVLQKENMETLENIKEENMETLENIKEKIKNNDVNHREGRVSKFLEARTTKLPTDLFLWSSIAAMGASLTLKLLKKDKISLFVGQWASPFLLMGVYNKLVKLHGSER